MPADIPSCKDTKKNQQLRFIVTIATFFCPINYRAKRAALRQYGRVGHNVGHQKRGARAHYFPVGA